jgi:glycosyltransferase involved in cell wall biosynthesis
LICVSRVAEKSFFGDFALFDPILLRRGRRHFTIPNCVDLAEVDRIAAGVQPSTLRHALGLNGHPIVAAVARLSAEKGISTLIRSMTQVIRQMPEARLLIIGDGPERAALETEARTNHIADQIRWVGRLPQTEVFKHLAIADIVAVPSRFEGFGLTAAEAMAFGKAVVASAVDGLKEVVTNESTGLLVDVDDVPDMSRCIVRLLANPGEREHMGHAGRARVERDYSFQAFADRWSSLYDVLS